MPEITLFVIFPELYKKLSLKYLANYESGIRIIYIPKKQFQVQPDLLKGLFADFIWECPRDRLQLVNTVYTLRLIIKNFA